jgi:hypothetical protein
MERERAKDGDRQTAIERQKDRETEGQRGVAGSTTGPPAPGEQSVIVWESRTHTLGQ